MEFLKSIAQAIMQKLKCMIGEKKDDEPEDSATKYNEAIAAAAEGGHIDIIRLCKQWGATDFNHAMVTAAEGGHIDIVRQLKKWGAIDYNWVMLHAAEGGHNDIV